MVFFFETEIRYTAALIDARPHLNCNNIYNITTNAIKPTTF